MLLLNLVPDGVLYTLSGVVAVAVVSCGIGRGGFETDNITTQLVLSAAYVKTVTAAIVAVERSSK